MTAIACTIATWRDGDLLAEAVASAAPHVDRVIVLDGAYAGLGVASSSHEWELAGAARAGADVFRPHPSATLWPDEIGKRNVLLELARALVPVPVPELGRRFVLVLDADEVLVDGDELAAWTRSFAGAPGLVRVEPNGAAWWAPSRLFELTAGVRYFRRSYWLQDGPVTVSLEHRAAEPAELAGLAGWPRIEHRWHRRSPERADVQRAWGRRLAELDGIDG